MIDSGRPITEVALILGHARLQTTARYTQPGWEDLEQAVESGTLGRLAMPTKSHAINLR
jgi:integrase/recombinase XerC